MKVYAYLRVSTDHQTLAQQTNAINDYIRVKSLQIDEVVTDEGVSGGVTYKKRNLYGLVKEMKQGDVLVVSEISRLGRSMCDLNKLVNDEMKPRKLRLIVVGMGIDMDCAKLKAIDEMLLYSFSFAAQVERELLQERVRNAMEARRKQLERDGYWISKSGNKTTGFGSAGMTPEQREKAAEKKRIKAAQNETNLFFARYVKTYESRCGKLTANSGKEHFEAIANELNLLGRKTSTGLPYTGTRVRALWVRMKEREYLNIE